MSNILFDSLKKYQKIKRSPFHTPGHKGVALKRYDIMSLDYTELPDTDSLYECKSIIRQAEDELSVLYGSSRTLISCGGNTLNIQAMIRLVAPTGGKILCDRIVHRSAVSAMALLGVEPIWIPRKIDQKSGLATQVDMDVIKSALTKNNDIKAVYITSPDYYGIMQDIKAIAEKCKEHDIPLIVDNAHGSHLKFVRNGMHPIELGATMSADSAHKTLPVLTGGAWLHIADKKYVANAKEAMALFGSTSPSYPTMASIDLCRSWLSTSGYSEFAKLEQNVKNVRDICKERGVYIPDEDITDPCRLTLGVWSVGMSGYKFREYLYRFKIEAEFCDENYVVLVPSPFNKVADWNRITRAIDKLKYEVSNTSPITLKVTDKVTPLPKVECSLRSAVMSKQEKLKVDFALGRVSAETTFSCPPAVPVIMPGEFIGNAEQELLHKHGIKEISVVK